MVNNGDNSNEKHIWFYIEKKIFLKRNIKQFNCILLLIDISKWKIIFLILEYDFSFIFFSAIFIQNENHSYDFHVYIYIREIYIYSIYKNEIHFPIIWISLLRYIRICILIYISIASYARILRKRVGLLYKLLNVPEINPLSSAISIFENDIQIL